MDRYSKYHQIEISPWQELWRKEPPFNVLVRALLSNDTEIVVERIKAGGKGDGQPSAYHRVGDVTNKDYRLHIVAWRWLTEKEKITDSSNKINHPAHYGGEGNPYECIKVLEQWLSKDELEGALKFNVFKYLQRYTQKNGLQDLYKAQWYLDRLIKHLENLTDKPSNDHD